MAGGTRGQEFKEMEESVRLLKEGQERHTNEMGEIKNSLKDLGDIKEMFTTITLKYDQLATHVYGKHHQESFRVSENQLELVGSSHPAPPFGTRYAKIDFPKFFGDDPNDWVYKCERFFEYNYVDNNNKVRLVVLHLEDKAIQWYQSQPPLSCRPASTGRLAAYAPWSLHCLLSRPPWSVAAERGGLLCSRVPHRLVWAAMCSYNHWDFPLGKLRAMLQTKDEQVRSLKKQSTFLSQLAAKTIPNGIHCLSMRLTIDYYLLPLEKRRFPKSENLENPELYHYALFSDNVLAASVVVNSTIRNAKEPEKHVFHLVTDKLNFGAMNMWFLLYPPGKATIHVENVNEFKWLNSSYGPVLRQLESASMKEYYFRADHPTTLSAGSSNLNPEGLDKIAVSGSPWKCDGAVETCGEGFHRFDKYLNFSNPYIARNFARNACGWAYWMNIFYLKEWKRKDITGIYHKWQSMDDMSQGGLLRYSKVPVILDQVYQV
ncbi:hypothetical protein RHMOL_Rhmol07G0026600 [Rhododendron molle]|uniref:Uncharacterized protein n=1 Tax=Rhododendron molle TaxID=49168 RepID=A0ACC0MWF3_RHOML|nr:hypothetical protein RHMOL_Rhmol07G0026600 [Rhododendron molle]